MPELLNRHVGQHRIPGVCWCCASAAPVRPCKYHVTGLVKNLCKGCENGSQAANLLKPLPRKSKIKFLGDVPANTKLRVQFVGSDGDWDDERQKWIDRNTGAVLTGQTVWEDNSMYFRPDIVKNIILHDDEVIILCN